MLVKTLIKKLRLMDPDLPVVEWSCQIGKNEPMYGFTKYSHMRVVRLKKKSERKRPLRGGPGYIETTNKKAIKALYLFSMKGTEIFK